MRIDRRLAFASYTSNDLARSGFVGTVWMSFYILLAIYTVFHPGHSLKLRTNTAVVSASVEGGGPVRDVALRPHHDRAAR